MTVPAAEWGAASHQEGTELGVQQLNQARQPCQLRLHPAAVGAEVGLRAQVAGRPVVEEMHYKKQGSCANGLYPSRLGMPDALDKKQKLPCPT